MVVEMMAQHRRGEMMADGNSDNGVMVVGTCGGQDMADDNNAKTGWPKLHQLVAECC